MLQIVVRTLLIFALFWPLNESKKFYSVGEKPVNRYKTKFEVTLIMQGDLMLKRQCECITHAKCGVRNFIKLYGTSCPRPEHVCCVIIQPHTLIDIDDYDNTHLTTSLSQYRKSPAENFSTKISP